jgi:hypothetical protein
MKPVSPVIPTADLPETVIAENQPEYENLPAIQCGKGIILTRWKLTDEEIEIVKETGDIYLFMWTFGKPVMPIALQVEKPEIGEPITDETLESAIITEG